MRLGCCGSPDDAASFRDAGFDFLEVNVQGVLKGTEDDAAWSAAAPDRDRLALPIEAANGLVPGSLPIVGPDRDPAALQRYMANVAARAQRLGISRLVFGSGAARRRPEGVSPADAMAQITEFARMAAEQCGEHDVILVVEHLNRGETNTINTLAEELELIERVGHPACGALVDSYHLGLENESDEAVLSLGNRIRHVHLAEVKDRVQPGAHGPYGAPGTPREAYDFESFFCLLHKLGYAERVSLECKWSKPVSDVGAETVRTLRKMWAAASRCGQ